MTLSGKWRQLHRERFPELPEDCGGPAFASEDEDLRDWSRKTTTPDQYRIERYIDRFDLRDRRILHIGIGNSGLARRFHGRVGEIVGTTLDEPEIELARRLGYPNYRVVLHNKYSGAAEAIPGRFDFILDNNLASACCCVTHLAELFKLLEGKLSENGLIVTDREGLAWIPRGTNPRWSFNLNDLAALASVAGFDAWRINRNTWVLCHGRPGHPALGPRLRASIRRMHRFAKRVVHGSHRRITSVLRE